MRLWHSRPNNIVTSRHHNTLQHCSLLVMLQPRPTSAALSGYVSTHRHKLFRHYRVGWCPDAPRHPAQLRRAARLQRGAACSGAEDAPVGQHWGKRGNGLAFATPAYVIQEVVDCVRALVCHVLAPVWMCVHLWTGGGAISGSGREVLGPCCYCARATWELGRKGRLNPPRSPPSITPNTHSHIRSQ